MGLIPRVLAVFLLALPAYAQQNYITVASTTSTEQSGLFRHLLPIFEKKTGIQVRVVALGTGQALDMGKRGDADVVFVHARPLEEKLELWKAAGVDPAAGKGSWYRETGSGMGAALNTAAGMDAYILADRGTWLSFKNRGELAILVEGDKRLFNQYGIMLVRQSAKKELGQAFIDWIVSSKGQDAIAAYRIGGQQLFFPNAL